MDNKIQEIIALGGAECELCGQRMLKADGCTWGYIEHKGQLIKRIKYGAESAEWVDERCHDCGTMPGHFHHFGCDVEECPICGEQLIGCDCDFSYSDGQPDEDTVDFERTEVDPAPEGSVLTVSKIKTRAKKHDMMLMGDGHGGYYLTDFNKCVVAPGPMSLIQVSMWLDDLDEMSAKTE